MQIVLPAEIKNGIVRYVDGTTGEKPPAQISMSGNITTLKPFAVAVVELK